MNFGLRGRRRSTGSASSASAAALEPAIIKELIELRDFRAQLLSPIVVADTFNVQTVGDKERLALQVWAGGAFESLEAVRKANPALMQVLEAQVSNTYDADGRAGEGHAARKARLLDGVLCILLRAASQFNIPLLAADLSIMSAGHCVPESFHESVRLSSFMLLTDTWVSGFMEFAREFRPPPDWLPLKGVAAAVFDNLSMRVDYGSFVVDGQGGQLLHMTNWLHTAIPRHLAPPSFDAERIFRTGMFRKDLSLDAFCRQFFLTDAAVVANQSQRWTRYMHAVRNGRLLSRPPIKPTWKPHKVYEPPMFGKLQSSYADVEYEFNEMRNNFNGHFFMFAAGDGLALMRANSLLAEKSDKYLEQTPVIIPIQGEAPHGLGHGLHGHWRMYKRFLMKAAQVLNNPQLKEDWGISELNVHRFFTLNVMTPACCEYIMELCEGDPDAEDWEDPRAFMAKADNNIDFAWLCHFLHEAAFWVLDFLQSVRGNESKNLDLLWREFFATAHSGTAHKVQYTIMAVMRVFWGQAMVPELDALYHAIRTIPTGDHDGCGVGWDWPIENLNGAIKSHVDTRVSEAQVRNFVADWALVETVQQDFRRIIDANSADRHWRGRDVRVDIEKLKAFFRATIGSTWAHATRHNTSPSVLLGETRTAAPWEEKARVMAQTGVAAPHAFIQSKVTNLTPFFPWCP